MQGGWGDSGPLVATLSHCQVVVVYSLYPFGVQWVMLGMVVDLLAR